MINGFQPATIIQINKNVNVLLHSSFLVSLARNCKCLFSENRTGSISKLLTISSILFLLLISVEKQLSLLGQYMFKIIVIQQLIGKWVMMLLFTK
jgi:hypothetical protein